MEPCRVLALTGRHSPELGAFRSMFNEICDSRRWAPGVGVSPAAIQKLRVGLLE